MTKTLTEMTAEIVASMASNKAMSLDEMEDNLHKVFESLKNIWDEEKITTRPVSKKRVLNRYSQLVPKASAADPISSIREDRVICLECKKQFRHLTHTHLRSHGLTPATYREKYGIPVKQPLMADTVRIKKHFKAIKSSGKRTARDSKARAV